MTDDAASLRSSKETCTFSLAVVRLVAVSLVKHRKLQLDVHVDSSSMISNQATLFKNDHKQLTCM